MKTNIITPTSTIKEPRTVQVKLLVPYALLVVLFVAIASVITGWFVHANYTGNVQEAAASMVANLQPKK